ncbi:hypothetical protein pneo_cds_1009 [Pandoravirus neocaledonia]|uniref:Uncharacterized protein n=1 Tax=Pandoravirus neocaledonia TaxID=2107708 RepID=A0A2U7UDW0_9VIRU|nr:hypothetical protein pneo_cds_1009 [Pandoravirus neocaledonia]AVK76616.1 hypothetical protein pneo_cds_1009 [Pandoravirus neocaledonia]
MESNDNRHTRDVGTSPPRANSATNATDPKHGNRNHLYEGDVDIRASSGDDEIADGDDDEIIVLPTLETAECAKGAGAFFMFCDGQWIRVPHCAS